MRSSLEILEMSTFHLDLATAVQTPAKKSVGASPLGRGFVPGEQVAEIVENEFVHGLVELRPLALVLPIHVHETHV